MCIRDSPYHVTQLTGRFVWGDGGHRTNFNEDPGNTIDDVVGFEVPSVFDVVDAAGGETILYAGKEKFDYIGRTYEDSLDVYERMNPLDAVDPFIANVVASQNRPTYAFFHIRFPDSAGHEFGFGSAGYQDAVTVSDGIVGEIIDNLEANGLLDSTTIILTSDHGGADGAVFHDAPGNQQVFTIPFIVNGPDAEPGADLYALNQGDGAFADPGNTRPDRDGVQPIRNHDAANLGLDLLDLPALPAPATNAGHDLDIN